MLFRKFCWIFLLSLTFTFPLTSLMIGNVEYQLPNGQSWKIAKEKTVDDATKSRTILFIPTTSTLENAEEFFGVHANQMPQILLSQDILEKALKQNYPDKQVSLKIISMDDHSVIYKWTANGMENDKLFGLTRFFTTSRNNVMLNYQTNEEKIFNQEYSMQLNNLRRAKIASFPKPAFQIPREPLYKF